MTRFHRPITFLSLTALATLLSACGNGSAGDAQPSATVPPVALTRETMNSLPLLPSPDLGNRIARLETAVAGLRADMDASKPTLAKMEAFDRQFRSLNLELERIGAMYAAQPVAERTIAIVPPVIAVAAPPKPTAKPVMEQPVKKTEKTEKPQPATQATAIVQGVRFGMVGGKTRLVVDLSGPAKYHYDLDAQENILVLELANSKIAPGLSPKPSGDLVASVTAEQNNGTGRIVVQLKKTAKVTQAAELKPDGKSGHRVYLDIAPL